MEKNKKIVFTPDYEMNDRVWLRHPDSVMYIVTNIYANVALKTLSYELMDGDGNYITCKTSQLSRTQVF